MNPAIIGLTARQLFGQKRTLLIVLLAIVPVVFAIIYRASGDHSSGPDDWVANTLFVRVIVGALLPFVALIFGTAALGTEFEDGTAVYILSKPVPRWKILGSKLAVAWVATAVFVIIASVVSAPIALSGGSGGAGLITGFVIAEVLAAFVYCAVFLALSIITAHALIIGLLYVFIWEAVLTGLFDGLRFFSVREYTVGLAHGLGNIPDTILDPHLSAVASFILLCVVGAVAVVLAVRWLSRWQIGETA
jgi:ABC-2 type transport system permease protein